MLQHRNLECGCPVWTADQTRLGSIAEVNGRFLRVRRTLRPDIWLPADSVLWADHDRVVMAFAREDLDRYRRKPLRPVVQAKG